jgi:holo-[acyl-carrier protein] synthase
VIAGIGIDACEVDRMRRVLAAPHGDRFRDRVFTEAEQAYCEARGRGRVQSYAVRFAAKEAAMKVLGTGWGDGVAWHDIEVVSGPTGQPALRLRGRAALLARRLGMASWFVSLTHTRATATAWVIAERGTVRARTGRRNRGAEAAAARPRPRARRRSR